MIFMNSKSQEPIRCATSINDVQEWYQFFVDSIYYNIKDTTIAFADGSGGSIVINNNKEDFRGNWLSSGACKICFDYKVDYNPDIELTPPGNIVKMFIYTGPVITSHATFLNATRAIYVEPSNAPQIPDDIWVNYCRRIDLCSFNPIKMPSNNDGGYWQIIKNGVVITDPESICSEWNLLITDITGIILATDYNAQISETVSMRNFCWYPCDSTTEVSTCCDSITLSASLTENNGAFNLNLNSGTTQIQEVEVSMVDYHATYSEPGCQPVNMDAGNGHIGYMNTTTHNLSSLNLVAAQNNSHALEWMPGSPAQLNHTVNFSVKPPSVINVSCCSVNFSFCIKVRVKDINCNVCEQFLCYPSSSTCHCGSWGNIPIQVIGIINSDRQSVQLNGTPVNCGDSITLQKGEYIFSVPDYSCIPNSNAATYQWMVQGPVSGSGTDKPFNFNFSQPGAYSVTITPFCCNQQCDPCEIKVIVPDPSCKCGKWNSSYMHLGINPQTPLSSRPFPVACGDSVTYDGPRSLHIGVGDFSCIPASCQATYKWEVSGPISGNDSGKPFDFYFSQAGTYTVTVTPYCGNQPCEPCKITVIIRPVPVTKCDCSGSGWIKDKPTLVLNVSGQVAESAFNGGSITLPSPGSYQFMAPPYICNLPPPECIAGYKWEIQGPVSDSGSGSSFSYNFTQPGSYAVIITAICGNSDCPAFVFKVIIGQSCDCGKWKDNKITVNWRDRRGNQTTTANCDNLEPYQLSNLCSNVPITGNFSDFICIPESCQAKYFWVVLDQNNNTVASGNDTTSTSFSFNIISGGNYQFVVTPKCGDNRCPTCRIRFSVKNVINCK